MFSLPVSALNATLVHIAVFLHRQTLTVAQITTTFSALSRTQPNCYLASKIICTTGASDSSQTFNYLFRYLIAVCRRSADKMCDCSSWWSFHYWLLPVTGSGSLAGSGGWRRQKHQQNNDDDDTTEGDNMIIFNGLGDGERMRMRVYIAMRVCVKELRSGGP